MNAPHFTDQGPPPPLSTGVVDRINFAIQFEKYRDMLLKRWWILLVCLSFGLAYGGYKTYGKPDIYISRGTMMVKPQVDTTRVAATPTDEMVNFYGTQVQLMQSGQVQSAALAKLADFAKKFNPPPTAQLSVYRVRDSSIFALSATSTSPEYAQRYLDQVMNSYIDYKRDIFDKAAVGVAYSVRKELNRKEEDLARAEQSLFDFQKQNNMVYFAGQGDVATKMLVETEQRVAQLKSALNLLDTETAERSLERLAQEQAVSETSHLPTDKNSATNQTAQSSAETRFPTGLKLQSSNTSSIRDNLAILQKELQERSKFLKPGHPEIVEINAKIQQLEELLIVAQERVKEEIADYRNGLVKELEAHQKEIPDLRSRAQEATEKNAQLMHLQTLVQQNKESCANLRKQLESLNASQSIAQEVISISEPASLSPVPIGPNRTKEILTSALIGLTVALAIIFLLERFDDRVKTVDELQDMVQEVALGQVPMMPLQSNHERLLMSGLPAHNTFSESFRNIRSSLMFSSVGGQARTIAVTSSIPGDGKTTCSVNLSICLAQAEQGRTLLIDADMRKMNIHHYFKMENGPGLSEVLSGQSSVEDCLVQTGVPNLDLLRAGSPPPNSGELILSSHFKDLLEKLKGYYHRIIIDTPPILATDDTLSMAPGIDGVVFVVRANQTSLRFVINSINSLKQRGAQILGLVLNQIDTNSAQHYYYYYYSNYYHSQGQKKAS